MFLPLHFSLNPCHNYIYKIILLHLTQFPSRMHFLLFYLPFIVTAKLLFASKGYCQVCMYEFSVNRKEPDSLPELQTLLYFPKCRCYPHRPHPSFAYSAFVPSSAIYDSTFHFSLFPYHSHLLP